MDKCKFIESWVGQCKNDVLKSGFCEEHQGITCISCGKQATHSCEETGQLVCGAPLCDDCEHTIAKDGTNGGIGFFRVSPLPKGYKQHCRKDAQVYTSWYTRDEYNQPLNSERKKAGSGSDSTE